MSSENYQAVLAKLNDEDEIEEASSKCTEWDKIFHEVT